MVVASGSVPACVAGYQCRTGLRGRPLGNFAIVESDRVRAVFRSVALFEVPNSCLQAHCVAIRSWFNLFTG